MPIADYADRQERKKERLEKRAAKMREESDRLLNAGHEALSAIPFGQPILIGHHSEKGDRAYRGRALSKIRKGYVLSNTAAHVEQRAEAVGTGGISSDDPEATRKLSDKLDKLQELQAIMKERNAEARANGQEAPFAGYQLSNNNANIYRIEKRIKQLERATITREDVKGNGWTYTESLEENRAMFIFDGVPDVPMRQLLKHHGFKWSPSRQAWVRLLNGNARYSADWIIQSLRQHPLFGNKPA